MITAAKDPTKVRAGQLGGRAHWGDDHDAKTVRLDALSVEQRALVLALIRAAKDQLTKKSASAASAETLLEVDRASDHHHRPES